MTVPGNLSSPLLATAAAAAAAAGPIKSLRFNGADQAYLARTFSSAGNTRTWTLSFWIKKVRDGGNWIFAARSPLNDSLINLVFNGNDEFEVGHYSFSSIRTARKYRDYSSWYHIVLAVDTTQATASNRIRVYTNGVEETSFTTATYPSQNTQYNVNTASLHTFAQSGSDYGSHQLADIYHIDGSQLDPTSFGAYDDNGVWQAAAYSGTFGTNGFHLLDFANESTIGHDSSGNNNDFTANNLDSGARAINTFGSISTSVSTEPFSGAGGAIGGGTTSDYVQVPAHADFSLNGVFTAEWFHYRASQYASANMWTLGDSKLSSGLELYWGSGGATLRLYTNDGSVDGSVTASSGWHHYAVVRDSSNNIKVYYDGTLAITQSSNSNTFSGAITFGEFYSGAITAGMLGPMSNFRLVNGSAVYTSNFTAPSSALTAITNTKLLTFQGSTIADASGSGAGAALDILFDVPTNGTQSDTGVGGEVSGNYATLNPLQTGSSLTLSNGNLALDGHSSWRSSYSTIFLPSGKWYFEVTIRGITSHSYGILIGLAGLGTNIIESEISSGDSYAVQNGPGNMKINYNGGSTDLGSQSAYAVGDVLQMAYDADNGKMWFGVNGTYINSGNPSAGSNPTQSNISGTYCFAVALLTTSDKIDCNFGQRSWAYSAPTNFKAVCTTNLATPTIADGSTVMDIVLYAGNNDSPRDISGLSFQPDWVWIKSRTSGAAHAVGDSVRGANKNLLPNETSDEATGLITGFNSDGFEINRLYDGATNGTVNGSGHNFVAWTWNAGANSNKTYTVTVVSDSGNKYRFDGHGTSAVTLDLAEGSTYVFDQSDSSNSGHPLRFSTTSDGTHGGGSEYTTGVTTTGTPGSAGAKTTIVVASGAPTLYYYCTNHSGMGGQANTNSTAGSTRLSSSLNASFYDQSVVWSNLLASTGTVINATNGFNGVLSNVAQAESGSYTLTIDLSNRGFTGDVEWYNANGNVQGASLNGGTDPTGSGTSAAGWYTLGTLASGDSCAITFNGNGSTPYCAALRIGGKLLIDSGISLSSFTQYPSINSVVKANPEAGFSIGKFTGTGSVGTVATGLTDTKMLILKNRDSSSNWVIYHTIVDGSYDYMYLNLTTANASSSLSHTMNTTFKVGTNTDTNASGDDYSFIAFEPVAGYSVFGTYESNGSADGPFVWTGFRPSVIIGKRSDATNGWFMFDSARDSYNVADAYLAANASAAEATYTFADFLSNGFKLRATTSDWNGSGGTVLYMAFAENPFQANGGLAR
jgi:hypothetical protein